MDVVSVPFGTDVEEAQLDRIERMLGEILEVHKRVEESVKQVMESPMLSAFMPKR